MRYPAQEIITINDRIYVSYDVSSFELSFVSLNIEFGIGGWKQRGL